MNIWHPSSWREFPAAQQPPYESAESLERVTARLQMLPPIVSIGEVESLKSVLADAAQGKRFVLHAGDCAERFVDCASRAIMRKLKIMMQMSLVLTYSSRKPVVRIGRIAGQFAKPRSKDTEVVDGVEMPIFRGDNINDSRPDPVLRRPDPERLERGYFCSVATLNFIRALVEGGFASLRAPEHWQMDFIPDSGAHAGFRDIADRIRDAIDYLSSLGAGSESLNHVDFFTSHEGLVLAYEEALTRRPSRGGRFYNLGAHYLWIGERTRQLDGAHIEYFRGIGNPIGVKVGPSTTPDTLLRLLDALDPDNEPGRVTIITRFGASKIRQCLPPLLRAVKGRGRTVLWSCDPMHGNTETMNGIKTRDFNHILGELTEALQIHREEGSALGGVHFELTGDNVTECVGGASKLMPTDLVRSYETLCDPRLNYEQSMEIAFLIARHLKTEGNAEPTKLWSWAAE